MTQIIAANIHFKPNRLSLLLFEFIFAHLLWVIYLWNCLCFNATQISWVSHEWKVLCCARLFCFEALTKDDFASLCDRRYSLLNWNLHTLEPRIRCQTPIYTGNETASGLARTSLQQFTVIGQTLMFKWLSIIIWRDSSQLHSCSVAVTY